jgi:hypothetical protein
MIVDAARAVTERKDFQNAKDEDEKIKVVYAVLFQRYPRGSEPSMAKDFIKEATKHYKPATTKPKTTTTAEETLETTVVSNSNMGILKNVGKPVERKPLTPWEAYIQALIMSNEFVYFN